MPYHIKQKNQIKTLQLFYAKLERSTDLHMKLFTSLIVNLKSFEMKDHILLV